MSISDEQASSDVDFVGGTTNINPVAGYSEYNFSLLPKTAPVCACAVHCVVGSDPYLQESLGLCSTSVILKIINPLKTERRPLYLKPQSVPRCKHFSSRL